MTVDPTAETAAETAREARGLAAGEMLGKYRLDRVLGSGGMGIVWAAFDPDLERAVAIKVLRSGDSDATLRSRLLREARAMARLKHPNVLTVYEVGTVGSRDYIAMELVDGDSLDVWLATRPPLGQVGEALIAAGRGLAAAHGAGLVHRDFKPHNVLRSRDGHVYVTDFGLARGQIEEGAEVQQIAVTALPDDLAAGSSFPRRVADSVLDSPLTQTGVLIGTPAYMAPEQFAGRAPDARSDQFAFCVTAWEALTGARPFRGASLGELEAAAAGGVRSTAGDLAPRVRAVLARGLDPHPAARWPDLQALLEALTEALAAQPPPVAAAAARPRRRALIAAGVGLALVGGGVGLFAARGGGTGSGSTDACGPAEAAFGDAWSPEQRAAVMEARPGEAFGSIAILDGVRSEWIERYRAACALPAGEERRESLICLHQARERVARTTARLVERGGSFDWGQVGALAAAVGMCDVHREMRGLRRSLPPFAAPEPPEPPDPPDLEDVPDPDPDPDPMPGPAGR